jgi:hypothetical protein
MTRGKGRRTKAAGFSRVQISARVFSPGRSPGYLFPCIWPVFGWPKSHCHVTLLVSHENGVVESTTPFCSQATDQYSLFSSRWRRRLKLAGGLSQP